MLDQSMDQKTLDEILEANKYLMDKMGVLQHHDAISGTAKQRIADDYAWRLFEGMAKNNEQYFKAIEEEIKDFSGSEPKDSWVQCFKTNTTWVDCPVE